MSISNMLQSKSLVHKQNFVNLFGTPQTRNWQNWTEFKKLTHFLTFQKLLTNKFEENQKRYFISATQVQKLAEFFQYRWVFPQTIYLGKFRKRIWSNLEKCISETSQAYLANINGSSIETTKVSLIFSLGNLLRKLLKFSQI